MLNKGMVQFALLHFDKNLTLDHLDHHTEYLYPYTRGKDPGARTLQSLQAEVGQEDWDPGRRSSRIPGLDRQGHFGVTVI
jgi:hypothetical protein